MPTNHFGSEQIGPEISYGLTDWTDVELDLLFMKNHAEGQSYTHIGDTLLMLGFQLLRQGTTDFPDIRLTFTEVFPTGRFNDLNPSKNGTDATGGGSYQSGLGLNFQHLTNISENIYLNTHFCINYLYTSPVSLHGISSYGGSQLTRGVIRPGNVLTLEMAGELSLTQNWVAVMEGFFLMQNASVFNGIIGPTRPRLSSEPNITRRRRILPFLYALFPTRFNQGGLGGIGNGGLDQFSLAPAVEYNFSENIGIIAGPWFTIAGKNVPQFVTAAIALNVSW